MKKQISITELKDRTVFSTKEAAAFVGVKEATFSHQIYSQGTIKPLRINPRLIVFSREQLEDYRLHKRTDIEFNETFYTFSDAAAYLSLDPKEMRDLVASGAISPVDGTAIGGQYIYTGEELDRVARLKGWTVSDEGQGEIG